MKRHIKIGSGGKHSFVTAIWSGIAIAVLLSTALTALVTSLVINGSIGERITNIFVFVIRALSVFLASIIGTAIVKEKYLQTIGIITAGYLAMILGMGIILYDSSFQNFISGTVSVLVGGLIAYLIQIRPRKTRKPSIKHIR